MRTWNKNFFGQFRSFSFAIALAAGASVTSPIVASGDSECHFHGNRPATEATVLTCAEMHKSRLIKKGTIESTWTNIKYDSIQQAGVKNGKREWKVIFKDPAAKDKAKENLYMFFSIPGNFLASNFTGN